MAELLKLIKHSSHYFIGQVFVVIVGLLSFPLLTRLLSPKEYGVMNLINISLLISITCSKFGIQQSAVRFYEEIKVGKRNESLAQYYSTLFFPPFLIGILMCLIIVIALVALPKVLIPEYIFIPLVIGMIIIPFRSSASVFVEFLRAEKKSKLLILYNISDRSISLLFMVSCILLSASRVQGVFLGRAISEVFFFTLIIFYLRKYSINLKHISTGFLFESIKFGVPLLGFEICFSILDYSDRYIIQYFLGSGQLGIYSAGYNLAAYIANVLTLPVMTAIYPIYMDLWVNKGESETKRFLSACINHIIMLLFPVILLLYSTGGDLIIFLASDKYTDGSIVIPFVFFGLAMFNLYNLYGAGLLIYKKVSNLTYTASLAIIVNVVLNYYFIPKYGILAAAITTLVSFALVAIGITVSSAKILGIDICYKSVMYYLLSSLLMFAVIERIPMTSILLARIISKGILGILVYVLLIGIFDKNWRLVFLSNFNKLSYLRRNDGSNK